MSYEAARNTIQAYVAANWTATPVAYDNVTFTPPTADPLDPVGTSWARLEIRHSASFQAGFGDSQRRYRRLGMAAFRIFVPEGAGPTYAMQLADTASQLFEALTLAGGIKLEPVSVIEQGIDEEGPWFRTDVIAQFRFDDVR